MIAIIPARGGSKRLPRKNIRLFCGRPIISYPLEAALASKLFDEVMVSTDDEEIAAIAKELGAVVPFIRSEQAASDLATTAEALIEVIKRYGESGKTFSHFCCIYPTAALITADDLLAAHALLIENNAESVLPVLAFSHPPQRGLTLTAQGTLLPLHPQNALVRSQDLAPVYHDSGSFYFIKTEVFLREESLLTMSTLPYFIDELHAHDLDNPVDWDLAEMKYKYRI